jgi:hypothetical protein
MALGVPLEENAKLSGYRESRRRRVKHFLISLCLRVSVLDIRLCIKFGRALYRE